MQVMPFWVGLIGRPGDDLFNLRTNLRYGSIASARAEEHTRPGGRALQSGKMDAIVF